MTEIKYEPIPIETIVKYNENGEFKPVKFIYADEMYVIDTVYSKNIGAMPGTQFAKQVFTCLVRGQKRKLYYDKYENKWYIVKEVEVKTSIFNPAEFEGC